MIKKNLLIIFAALSFWSAYPSSDIPKLTGSIFKAAPTKLQILKYNLLGDGVIGSSKITFTNEKEFIYKSCSSSTPLKGEWHTSRDTLFLEGEHHLFPLFFIIKSNDKMVSKRRLKSRRLIEILKRQ
ncbi:MAG: hypothetical protein ACPG19_02780 [Saprospiraceae bacterium]